MLPVKTPIFVKSDVEQEEVADRGASSTMRPLTSRTAGIIAADICWSGCARFGRGPRGSSAQRLHLFACIPTSLSSYRREKAGRRSDTVSGSLHAQWRSKRLANRQRGRDIDARVVAERKFLDKMVATLPSVGSAKDFKQRNYPTDLSTSRGNQ